MIARADVVVDINQNHQINRPWNLRIFGFALNCRQISQPLFFSPFTEMAHHIGFQIDRVDPPSRQHMREPHREVSGAGADISDRGLRGEL